MRTTPENTNSQLRSFGEKRESLESNGWVRVYWPEVWMIGQDRSNSHIVLQIILNDGRVFTTSGDSFIEQLEPGT